MSEDFNLPNDCISITFHSVKELKQDKKRTGRRIRTIKKHRYDFHCQGPLRKANSRKDFSGFYCSGSRVHWKIQIVVKKGELRLYLDWQD